MTLGLAGKKAIDVYRDAHMMDEFDQIMRMRFWSARRAAASR